MKRVLVLLEHGAIRAKKKVPSGSPGQVDFPYGQVTFHSHWSNVQGIWQVVSQLNHFKKQQARQAKL